MPAHSRSRRSFLRFLASSPAIAWSQKLSRSQEDAILKSAKDVLAVKDFEEIAHSKLPPAHWGYLKGATDDDATYRANIEGFSRIELRPHRLVDISQADTRGDLFGFPFDAPVFLCPLSGQKMFHPEGEVGSARGARAKNAIQALSTQTSSSVEEVAKALGRPPWYQLYMPATWEGTEKMIRRVEAVGCSVLIMTVDMTGNNGITAKRFARLDTRNCLECHKDAGGGRLGVPPGMRPMEEGIGQDLARPAWEHVDHLKKITKMKLVLKGIETREDARLCRQHGVDGIVVSNHGGRAIEDLRPTIESLPEVIDGAGSGMKIMIDSGFRRGTDVYKALALGASAVGIGRPYVWGLTAFGAEGVERVLDILQTELLMTMRQCGTPTLAQITRSSVQVNEARA
ncbi:MAG: alpha-hydroxy-acid oxidizing protein [Bryobacterales bacterium]|nr:alpha-hydroxy-acid oxidizing protein [Bryobacterales bacterium]